MTKKTLDLAPDLSLPIDAVLHTFAFIGIRGAGKTVAATVMAEEMSEAGLPWIAFDPIGVWWGLRANPDGTPGGYPVVIIGGEHADLPLDRDGGARVAEAILQENIACILDLSRESKNVWRKFVADFCDRMMEIRPAYPRHVFIEEAPEFIPQRPMGEQKRSLAAVDRIARLGRNNGYGMSLISQRYATVQKDVLTQCESLFAGRMIGKPDRAACEDWMIEAAGISEKEAKKFIDSLATLDNGRFWFWSPQWLGKFGPAQIRNRKTYHPGATRTMGEAPKQVALSDVRDFVSRFEQVLNEKPAKVRAPAPEEKVETVTVEAIQLTAAQEEANRLRAELAQVRRERDAVNAALSAARTLFEPQYKTLQKLFGELNAVAAASNGSVDRSIYEPWLRRASQKGCLRILKVLLDRPELTKSQLSTLSGIPPTTIVKNGYWAWLLKNGLVDIDGETVRLKAI